MFCSPGLSGEFVASDEPNRGNHLVLTRHGNSGRSIAMVSHLDTVYPLTKRSETAFGGVSKATGFMDPVRTTSKAGR
jgi:hypothetical protein